MAFTLAEPHQQPHHLLALPQPTSRGRTVMTPTLLLLIQLMVVVVVAYSVDTVKAWVLVPRAALSPPLQPPRRRNILRPGLGASFSTTTTSSLGMKTTGKSSASAIATAYYSAADSSVSRNLNQTDYTNNNNTPQQQPLLLRNEIHWTLDPSELLLLSSPLSSNSLETRDTTTTATTTSVEATTSVTTDAEMVPTTTASASCSSSITTITPPIQDNHHHEMIAVVQNAPDNNINDDSIAPPQQQQVADDADAAVWRARWLLIVAAALYGTNFSCVKILGDSVPVGISSTLRFGMAALATAPWLFWGLQRKNNNETKSLGEFNSDNALNLDQTAAWGAILAGFQVGFWNSIGYVAQAVGLETTLASKSAFLCSLAVVIVPVIDWVTGKRLQQKQWLGAILALLGVAFLELGGESAADVLQLSRGDLASLVQPLAFGMGFWQMEQAMRKFPDQATRCTAAQLMAVFATSLVYTLGTDAHALVDWPQLQQWLSSPEIVAALLWTGVVTTAVSVYLETLALKSLTAAETTLIFSTEPLWGSLFAAWFMGETFGWDAAVGGGLILIGCIYSNLGWKGLSDAVRTALMGATKNSTPPPPPTDHLPLP